MLALRRISIVAVAVIASIASTGCSSMYYKTMETFGKHKRDILRDRVEAGKVEQEEAKEQFASALEQFRSVVAVDGGELEKKYNTLNSEYERCSSRADAVRERIDSIEEVSQALFKEWEEEIEQYESAKLRRSSEDQLRNSRQRYEQLIAAMHKAEGKMDPVLAVFKDNVLFLKHNLNAQAIESLKDNVIEIESEVADLIADMESAIAEATAFIESME
ncbi:MAG: DUF2959 domain-containing protein [Planctomycetes bacterium]|nr:DUF2959 domain-containing protein [Planctomycetota bacterium]